MLGKNVTMNCIQNKLDDGKELCARKRFNQEQLSSYMLQREGENLLFFVKEALVRRKKGTNFSRFKNIFLYLFDRLAVSILREIQIYISVTR
jgi:hypothetical protein